MPTGYRKCDFEIFSWFLWSLHFTICDATRDTSGVNWPLECDHFYDACLKATSRRPVWDYAKLLTANVILST